MPFIRTKRIKGKRYAYLVENTWKKKGSRQQVKAYLGPVLEQGTLPPPDVHDSTKPSEIMNSLLAHELQGLEVEVSVAKATVSKHGKDVVVAMNGGYLCAHTLKALRKAHLARNEERPGLALAEAFSRAGIRITPEQFISVYRSKR